MYGGVRGGSGNPTHLLDSNMVIETPHRHPPVEQLRTASKIARLYGRYQTLKAKIPLAFDSQCAGISVIMDRLLKTTVPRSRSFGFRHVTRERTNINFTDTARPCLD